VVVSAVAGLAGVGKTTLAVQAGHAAGARGWYQGGVLFLDLHGYDDQPVQPGQALEFAWTAGRLFYCGKHRRDGMNLRAIVTPDGEIVWVFGPPPMPCTT
jgi:predicted ATPase